MEKNKILLDFQDKLYKISELPVRDCQEARTKEQMIYACQNEMYFVEHYDFES